MTMALIFLGVSVLNASAQQDMWEMRCPEDMVYVPTGEFVMGSTEYKDEEPVRRIYVDGFYIDQYPITNAQFKAFVDATEHRTLAEDIGKAEIPVSERQWKTIRGVCWRSPEGPESTIEGRMDHPVVHVGYRDAVAYCQWVGKRLPTEAEWEKACRGTDGRRFPWGNEWEEGRHTRPQPRIYRTSPVGQHPYGSSPYGAMDMVGLVRQWTSDEEKLPGVTRNSSEGLLRIIKGQTRVSFALRCAWRRGKYEKRPPWIVEGFRCAKDLR